LWVDQHLKLGHAKELAAGKLQSAATVRACDPSAWRLSPYRLTSQPFYHDVVFPRVCFAYS